MLRWALFFLIIALLAGFLSFGYLAGVAGTIAKWIFIAAVIFFIYELVFGTKKPKFKFKKKRRSR